MKFFEDCQVQYDDCDETKNLKLSSMIDKLMEVSEHQLEGTLGSTQTMLKKGIGWVVTQYEFHIQRLPKALENVKLWTDPIGYNRFLCYRDFGIQNEEGQDIVLVHSQWVLFDIKNRKMLPTDLNIVKDLGIPKLSKMPRFARLRALDNYDTFNTYRVRYYDLDTNHHMTNGHYFNWIVDTLDRKFLNTHQPVRIDLKFEQEVKYGDNAQARLKVENVDEFVKTSHLITVDDNNMAICEIEWGAR